MLSIPFTNKAVRFTSALCLSAALLLSLASCGTASNTPKPDPSSAPSDAAQASKPSTGSAPPSAAKSPTASAPPAPSPKSPAAKPPAGSSGGATSTDQGQKPVDDSYDTDLERSLKNALDDADSKIAAHSDPKRKASLQSVPLSELPDTAPDLIPPLKDAKGIKTTRRGSGESYGFDFYISFTTGYSTKQAIMEYRKYLTGQNIDFTDKNEFFEWIFHGGTETWTFQINIAKDTDINGNPIPDPVYVNIGLHMNYRGNPDDDLTASSGADGAAAPSSGGASGSGDGGGSGGSAPEDVQVPDIVPMLSGATTVTKVRMSDNEYQLNYFLMSTLKAAVASYQKQLKARKYTFTDKELSFGLGWNFKGEGNGWKFTVVILTDPDAPEDETKPQNLMIQIHLLKK